MYPWLFFWAPQFHLPFGGSVAQRIEPNTNWFFDSIANTAGNPTIERKAFEVASYGRQLGLITEVLIDLAAKAPPGSERGQQSLARLRDIQSKIEGIKQRDADELAQEVCALVGALKRGHRDKFPKIRRDIERALAEGEAPTQSRAAANRG